MIVVFTNTDSVECKFIYFEGVQIKLTTWDDEVLECIDYMKKTNDTFNKWYHFRIG